MNTVTISDRNRSCGGICINKCTYTRVIINNNRFDCMSCSVDESSLYHKLSAFANRYDFIHTRSHNNTREDIVIVNPTASCLVELNSIIKDYAEES